METPVAATSDGYGTDPEIALDLDLELFPQALRL